MRQLKRQILYGAPILFLCALWLPCIIGGHSAEINGIRYWWLADDAMISMRYARNLAQGLGLVWNVGERIEGYTNPLWTLWMALPHLAGTSDARTSLFPLITNLLVACWCVIEAVRLTRQLGGGHIAQTAAGIFLAVNADFAFWAFSGLETILLTLLVLIIARRLLVELHQDGVGLTLTTCLLLSVLPLVRSDASVLMLLLLAVAVQRRRFAAPIWACALTAFALPAAAQVGRYVYYGDWLPNTAYLKIFGWPQRIDVGVEYSGRFLIRYIPLFILAGAAVIKRANPLFRGLPSAVVLYIAYVAYAGGDAFEHHRFFVPIIPLVAVAAIVSIQTLLSRDGQASARGEESEERQTPALQSGASESSDPAAQQVSAGSGAGDSSTLRNHWIAQAALIVTAPCLLWPPCYAELLHPAKEDLGNVRIGLLLRDNTSANARIADFWAGTVFYFSHRYGIDLLGKTDAKIARMPVVGNGRKPGHNKFNFDYSLGELKPDYVIPTWRLPVTPEWIEYVSTGDYAFAGLIHQHPVFRKHYLPNVIETHTWRTIFVRDTSSDAARPRDWK